jgi:hypothetical protein
MVIDGKKIGKVILEFFYINSETVGNLTETLDGILTLVQVHEMLFNSEMTVY